METNMEANETAARQRGVDYRQVRIERVKPQCIEAIETMRRFLDDAAREVSRDSTGPELAISITTSKLAWGFANVSGCLSNALAALEDARKIGEAA
jgi:hypothetical protein